jgi:hypothetical protein
LLHQGRFLNDLDCEDLVGLLRDEFVASGKAALAQEIALGVLCYRVVLEAVVLDDVQIFVGWVDRSLRSGWVREEVMRVTIL